MKRGGEEMLTERTILHGNKTERILQALKKAGWYEGRRVDISPVERYYESQNVELNAKAILFFREYYGLASRWYIEVANLEYASDFFFQLFPYPQEYRISVRDYMYDDADSTIESEEFQQAKAYAGENIVMVGEIGYYYPAKVYLSDSGAIYSTHDYNYEVRKFNSVIELIDDELKNHNLDSVAMKS